MARFLKNPDLTRSGKLAARLPIVADSTYGDTPVDGLIRFNQNPLDSLVPRIEFYYNVGCFYWLYATEEEAEAQLRKHLKSNRMLFPDSERADACEVRHIKIRHGVHQRAWEKNVVGIGLANGFIEPLESTGLYLTISGIRKICQYINNEITEDEKKIILKKVKEFHDLNKLVDRKQE